MGNFLTLTRPFKRIVRDSGSPYGLLLLALTTMLLVYPFLGTHKALSWVFDLVMFGVVAAALRSTRGRGLAYRLGWVFGLSTFGTGFLSRSLDVASAYPFSAGLRGLFFGYLIVVIFSEIIRRQKIDFDAVMGASCVLVLLGLTFSSAYVLLEWQIPGSFIIPEIPASIESVFGPTSTEFSLLYFSFVAMTTIGFGDIVPVAPPARGLAALEGLLAQLYLTIIIARLVGLEIANRLQEKRAREE